MFTHSYCPFARILTSIRRESGANLRRPLFRSARASTSSYSRKTRTCVKSRVWSGLIQWRANEQDLGWLWGPENAPSASEHTKNLVGALPECSNLAEYGRAVLGTACPQGKIALTHEAFGRLQSGDIAISSALPWEGPPARPELPLLVEPREVPGRKEAGMALAPYLIHNLAHIELNAIDLAWDTVVRFSGAPLPQQFFADFARVADDEARHLGWCLQRLEELGHRYGDLPSHRLLWRGCDASSGDIRARLAVVPMSQEARGLDSGARLVQRLVSAGDQRSASIVRRIAGEEMAHVAVGVEWFLAVCSALGEDPASTYRTVLSHVDLDLFRGEINYELRRIAGLEREWYDPAPETGASGGDEAQGAGKACGLTPLQESELRALGGRLGEIVGVECAMSSA